jgi:hypothetical protein
LQDIYPLVIRLDPKDNGRLYIDGYRLLNGPNRLLSLLGIKTKKVTTQNIVATDYQNYLAWVTCNDNSLLYSYNSFQIAVRDLSKADDIVNKILLNIIKLAEIKKFNEKNLLRISHGSECNGFPF